MTVAATMVNPSTSQLACDRLMWNWVAVASSAMFMSDWLNDARRLLPSISAIMAHIARPVGMAGDTASPFAGAATGAAVRPAEVRWRLRKGWTGAGEVVWDIAAHKAFTRSGVGNRTAPQGIFPHSTPPPLRCNASSLSRSGPDAKG